MIIKKDNYYFRYPSTRKYKKYDAFDKDGKYLASFGDIRYQQYFDKIGAYSDLNHLDKMRRYLYKSRHKGDKNWAGFFSMNYLW